MDFKPPGRPELFEPGDENIWTAPYISKRMLEAHLNTGSDAASRSIATIKKTVKWINSMLPRKAKILDLGCGPGLYAEEFAKSGHSVKGIDINRNSIAYALESAGKKDLKIEYIHGSYFDINLDGQFDAAMMIYCDMGTHSDENRDKILQKIKKYLKPDGILIFDIFSEKLAEEKRENRSWDLCSDAGFWSDKPHLVLSETFHYKEWGLFCYQYIVVTENSQKIYRVWEHYYREDEIRQVLSNNGYEIVKIERGLIPKNDFASNEVMFLVCSPVAV